MISHFIDWLLVRIQPAEPHTTNRPHRTVSVSGSVYMMKSELSTSRKATNIARAERVVA